MNSNTPIYQPRFKPGQFICDLNPQEWEHVHHCKVQPRPGLLFLRGLHFALQYTELALKRAFWLRPPLETQDELLPETDMPLLRGMFLEFGPDNRVSLYDIVTDIALHWKRNTGFIMVVDNESREAHAICREGDSSKLSYICQRRVVASGQKPYIIGVADIIRYAFIVVGNLEQSFAELDSALQRVANEKRIANPMLAVYIDPTNYPYLAMYFPEGNRYVRVDARAVEYLKVLLAQGQDLSEVPVFGIDGDRAELHEFVLLPRTP